jgi:hypothetical protein
MGTVFELSSREVGQFVIDDILSELPAYYAHVMHTNAPLMTYYRDSVETAGPFDWTGTEAQAKAAQRLSHFSPAAAVLTYAPSEAYSMKRDDNTTSLWSMCTALLGHAAMSLPIEPDTMERPLGTRDGGSSIEDMVRSMARAAMKSASPFVWHSERRHAPSQSSVCEKRRSTAAAASGRLMVEEISVDVPGGGKIHVRPAGGLSFPHFGYNQYRIGDVQRCVCATPLSGGMCAVSNETCASRHECMAEACAAGFYDPRAQADSILHCLTTVANTVRCPELAPSDIWGLFPAGCTTQECAIASSWVTGGGSVPFDGARFLTDGRGGLRIPNYRHVNATYHTAINYYQPQAQPQAQAQCFDEEELTRSNGEAVLERLLPAAQLRFDSPVTSVCSRYIVELARAEILGTGEAAAQAASWKRRCEAKIRQLAACDALGIYFDVEPQQIGGSCGALPPGGNFYFAAGGACVLVDRVNRIMYDGPMCAKNGLVVSLFCLFFNIVIRFRD